MLCDTLSCVTEAVSFGLTPVILGELTKTPVEKKYKEKYKTISKEDLYKEASRRKGSNVGILLDELLCIDVDIQNSGLSNWYDLLHENKIDDIDDLDTVTVKTGSNGRHYYFKLTPELEKCKAYLSNANGKITGIDVKRTGHLVYPGSVYGGCGDTTTHKCGVVNPEDCLFKYKMYQWIKSPSDIKIATVPDWLLKYINIPSGKRYNSERTDNYSPELLQACFEHLKKRADPYNEWRNMIWCIRGLGYDAELAHEFSKLSDRYDPESVDRVWESYDETKATWDWNVIFAWLKEDMQEEEYIAFCNTHFKEFEAPEIVLEGDWGLSMLFIEQIKDRLKLTDPKGNGYLYNRESRLWKRLPSEYLCNLISETLRPVLTDIVEQAEKRDMITGSKLAEIYRPILSRVLTTFGANAIMKQCLRGLADHSFLTRLNRSSMLLPIRDGRVINIKTLEIRQRESGDYFSFECPIDYKPSNEYKVAEEFFMGICKNDVEYVDYLRRLLAYFMTGEITDRHFYIFVGSGMNGKSTLIKLMEIMLGDFYKGLSESVMISQDRIGSCTPELLPLLDARLGVLPENRENVSLHSERLKAFTGDDTLVCRPLYSEEINFTTHAKLVLMTNTLPRFNASDKAMNDRLVVLPFHAVFPNNPGYKDKLIAHLDEIFTYILIRGEEFWKNRKVDNIPSIIQKEIQAYTKSNDVVGLFIEDCCEVSYNAKTKASELYDSYKEWSDESRIAVLDKNKFFTMMEKRFLKTRSRLGMIYNGICLKSSLESI
jgi:P4 family phage/plasmid primase-like protien